MVSYTKHSLKKIETLFEEIDYVIRYEKGNFQSGYCLVENKKIAVINKFFDTKARIMTLLDILSKVEIDSSHLSETNLKLYKSLFKDGQLNDEVTPEEIENHAQ